MDGIWHCLVADPSGAAATRLLQRVRERGEAAKHRRYQVTGDAGLLYAMSLFHSFVQKLFPKCVANGSRFTLGVWGLRHVRSTLLLRPQPFATVRNRPQAFATVWPCLRRVLQSFGGFNRRVTSFRVVGVALRDIPTCFIRCPELFLCGRRNIFARFSEDDLHCW